VIMWVVFRTSHPEEGYLPHYQRRRPTDEKLVPDLLRGRGKSIGGGPDVDDEGSE
jgi:hypothetical protein